MSLPDHGSGMFGLLLSRLRHERGLDIVGFMRMCRQSDEVALKGVSTASIFDYELGNSLPRPGRAGALARLLESPSLLQAHQEEYKPPSAYHWMVRSDEAIEATRQAKAEVLRGQLRSEDFCQAQSRRQKGRPMPEVVRQASLEVRTIQDEFTGRGNKDWRRRQRKRKARGVVPHGNSIQDEFTGQKTRAWRYKQRRKRKVQAVPKEDKRVIQDEFTGQGTAEWRRQQREYKARGFTPQVHIIQDEFTGQGTGAWRYRQRKKRDA
jgi:hypothetical protein